MAGGKWTAQNKVRAGAYVNFRSQNAVRASKGDRGIVALPLELPWGAPGELITVTADDFFSGRAFATVGLTPRDPGAKLLAAVLANAYEARVFRLGSGGSPSTAALAGNDVGTLIVTAKYPGKWGNNITFKIAKNGETTYAVETFVLGELRDRQVIGDLFELVGNDFVTFGGNGTDGKPTGVPPVTAGEPLDNGQDGTVSGEDYNAFYTALKTARWGYMCIPAQGSGIVNLWDAVDFISDMRDKEGRYVQGVFANIEADHEGVINVTSGAVINGVTFQPHEFAAYAAGMEAGADEVASLTGAVIPGATAIVGELDNAGIIAALQDGQFVLSSRMDGSVQVEMDINSLHNFTDDKDERFSKNRIVRVLDLLGTRITTTWENNFKGKISNEDEGRGLFRAEVVGIMANLATQGALTNFEGVSDVEVLKGEAENAVVCNIAAQPVDAMEKLYTTVNLTV